jgi:hypothetical protein
MDSTGVTGPGLNFDPGLQRAPLGLDQEYPLSRDEEKRPPRTPGLPGFLRPCPAIALLLLITTDAGVPGNEVERFRQGVDRQARKRSWTSETSAPYNGKGGRNQGRGDDPYYEYDEIELRKKYNESNDEEEKARIKRIQKEGICKQKEAW